MGWGRLFSRAGKGVIRDRTLTNKKKDLLSRGEKVPLHAIFRETKKKVAGLSSQARASSGGRGKKGNCARGGSKLSRKLT